MRISDWSSDVCSSDLRIVGLIIGQARRRVDRRSQEGAQYTADAPAESEILSCRRRAVEPAFGHRRRHDAIGRQLDTRRDGRGLRDAVGEGADGHRRLPDDKMGREAGGGCGWTSGEAWAGSTLKK